MSTTIDLCRAGEAALDAERWADAGRLFAQAVEREPSCVNAWSGLAAAQETQGLYAEARAAYEQVLVFEERQPVLTLLGAVQHHLHDDPAAVATLRRSLELKGDDDEAHYHLGLALRSSDLEGSLQHLQESHRLDPGVAKTTREIGGADGVAAGSRHGRRPAVPARHRRRDGRRDRVSRVRPVPASTRTVDVGSLLPEAGRRSRRQRSAGPSGVGGAR